MKKGIIKRVLLIPGIWIVMMLAAATVYAASQADFSDGEAATKKYTISVYDKNGVEVQRIIKKKNASFVTPSRKNAGGKTFLGWSVSPSGKSADYRAGQKIIVRRNMKLYPVYFNSIKESTVSWGSLPKLDLSKYKMVIFVGDSRTYRMGLRFESDRSTEIITGVKFVGKGGAGLWWLKNIGYRELIKTINLCNRENKSKKEIAVVFNLGVNDLICKNGKLVNTEIITDRYASYMSKIKNSLIGKNCRLFYMSVNPTNCTMSKTKGLRKAKEIEEFNILLKKKISGQYQWINCVDYLTRKGYAFDSGIKRESGRDDGVHYTEATYQMIYRYCIQKINNS